jgi:hypothetical protein
MSGVEDPTQPRATAPFFFFSSSLVRTSFTVSRVPGVQLYGTRRFSGWIDRRKVRNRYVHFVPDTYCG